MAETLVEETSVEENIYGIAPEMRKEYRNKFDRMIRKQGIKAAHTKEDLYRHPKNKG